MIGMVIEILDTRKVFTDETPEDERKPGRVHGLILNGWVVDDLEPRFLIGVLEEGEIDDDTDDRRNIDGHRWFSHGTILNLSYRNFALAPIPEEVTEAAKMESFKTRLGIGGRGGYA